MKYYTLETLIENNQSYHAKHRVTQADVDEVNRHIDLIEASRTLEFPVVGDALRYTNKFGEYHPYAHIDGVHFNDDEDDEGRGYINICESGSEPFLSFTEDGRPMTSKSGGAWANIELPVLLKDPQQKQFMIWGHSGPTANGAVCFSAEVNTWEYYPEDLEFSTATHDKFDLTVLEQPESMGYRYLVSKGPISFTAFRTKEDYQAWLTTFNGVERDGFRPNNYIIWTDKMEPHTIPLASYKEQEGEVDTQMINGSIQECKRIYREGRVITYSPYQADRIDMPGELPYRNARLKNK